jgi:hypothetical protein
MTAPDGHPVGALPSGAFGARSPRTPRCVVAVRPTMPGELAPKALTGALRSEACGPQATVT